MTSVVFHCSSLLQRMMVRAAFIGCLAVSSTAFGKEDVAVELTAQRVGAPVDGKEKLEPADQVKPGDVLKYQAVYRNTGAKGVSGLQATVPIPAGLEVLLETAKPAAPQASLDGKTFAATPLMRSVTQADGTASKEPVPPRQIRAVRWLTPQLAAGGKFIVSVRARVLTTAPAESKP